MIIGGIIQARAGSRRFPNKILHDLPYGSGISLLAQIIRRVKESELIDKVIVCTPSSKENDKIEQITSEENVLCSRIEQPNRDVLTEFYIAAQKNGCDVVVRLTGDCPYIDPKIIDHIVGTHLKSNADYTCNHYDVNTKEAKSAGVVKTVSQWPDGFDVEVISFPALHKAYKHAKTPYDREHVTPYFYNTKPEEFKIVYIHKPPTEMDPSLLLSVNEKKDYTLACAVYDKLGSDFTAAELMDCLEENPWMLDINN